MACDVAHYISILYRHGLQIRANKGYMPIKISNKNIHRYPTYLHSQTTGSKNCFKSKELSELKTSHFFNK